MAEQNEASAGERRKFARLRKEFLVKVASVADNLVATPRPSLPASAIAEITGTNISLGGIALETNKAYRVGNILSLEALLPEGETGKAETAPTDPSGGLTLLRAECEVIWCNVAPNDRFSVGLRFLNLNEDQFKALSQLIAEETE